MYVIDKEIQVWILKSKFLHSRRESLKYQKSIQKIFLEKSQIDFFWKQRSKQTNQITKQNENLQGLEFQTNTIDAGDVQNSNFSSSYVCSYTSINWARTTRLTFAKHFKFLLEYSLVFTINEILVCYIHFRQAWKVTANFSLHPF